MDSHQPVFDEMRSVLQSSAHRQAKTERVAEIIRGAGRYRWVGIYEVDGEEIAAVAWSGLGRPTYPRFPSSQGLCGAAVRSGRTVVVGDVTKDPRYLTTFDTTRSEIVVPISRSATGAALGLIDVESEELNAFTDDHRGFLERCAALLADLWK